MPDGDGVKRTFRIEVLEYVGGSNQVWIPRLMTKITAESTLGALNGVAAAETAKAQRSTSQGSAIERYLKPSEAHKSWSADCDHGPNCAECRP
jgi:hypothetical protein